MGKRGKINVPKHIASGPGERIETTVLKRRKKIETLHAEKVARGQAQVKAAGQKRKLRQKIFRNARDFVNNFKRREAGKKTISRRQKVLKKQPVKVPTGTEGVVALVIRVRGHDIPAPCSRMLHNMRLNKMYDGAFVPVADNTLQNLHVLKDYVKWGYPTKEQVSGLLRTRAFTLNELGKRTPVEGNMIIEERLGAHGIICMEDLEHVILNRTEEFPAVAAFLAPFRFDPPDKDVAEKERRARERKTEAGENTFASYLLKSLPSLPSVAGAPAAASKQKKKALQA